MKIKYIITAFLTAFVFAGCQTEPMVGSFDDFSVDKTFVSIPMAGGSVDVNVTASGAWNFTKHYDTGKKDADKKAIKDYCPTWITLSTLEGNGNGKFTVIATATESGREVELQIKSGDHLQHIVVRQGTVEAVSATCKEIMEGPDGKNFKVRAKVTKIANTTYGNLYLDDGSYTGFSGGNADGVYVYGTLDKDGKEKNFTSLGIEVGDVITVSGPKTTYSGTVELVNVTVHKIEKALVKVVSVPEMAAKDGADVEVTIAYKGSGVYPAVEENCQDWIVYKNTAFKKGVATIFEKNPADTAIVTFSVAANTAGAREGVVNFTSSDGKNSTTQSVTIAQDGATIAAVSVAQFLAAPVSTATLYKVTGTITKVAKADYGNIYIRDHSGEMYVYGVGAKGDFNKLGLKEGDIVTLVGQRGEYNGSAQMAKGQYDSHIPVTTVTVAELRNAAESKEVWYRVTGKVTKPTEENTKWDITTYGNLNITDDSGSIYVYGVSTGINGESKKFSTLGVKEDDILTVIGYRTSYKGLVQIGGAMYVNHVPAN